MSHEDVAGSSRQRRVRATVITSEQDHLIDKGETVALRSSSVSVLKNDKPTSSRVLRACLHTWKLGREGDTFSLACSWCHATIKGKGLPAAFQHVLDAATKLDPIYHANEPAGKRWRVSEADIRAAVSLLHLPNRSRSQRSRNWDVYATLHILLSLKAGRARGNLAVKSKTLTKLIEVSMYPDRLSGMPVSSRKRYKFIVDAITLLPARLSQDSFSSAARPS